MADTFKGIITADGKKRQLPYGSILEAPVSDATLSVDGGFADSKAVGDKFKEVKAETDSLKGDLVELSKSVDNSVYTDFVDGEGWNGTVGEKIKTSLYELVSKMSLVNARVGDKFRLVTYGVGGWANRYYELDENLIVLYVHTGSGLLDGVIEISNENTRYLAINKGNSFNFEFYRYNENIAQNKADWYNEKVAEAVIDEQKKNPFVWRSFDKGVVVFTFDDSLSDIDLVESLSEEYGVPVCFSSIPSKMNNVTTATGTNKKVHEVLTIAEEHGNEVLCHSSVALSETSTDEEIYANFVTNKKLLEEYGYSVRGIIEAGSGGGELSFDTKRSEKYLRVMYEYSDHYGRNLGMPQYDTGRTYINRNTQNNHNVVDACERNKTLLIFVTHSITDESTSSINTSESILRDLMAYVKTKDVYLLTFKGVYDMFRSSELENKINQLLN